MHKLIEFKNLHENFMKSKESNEYEETLTKIDVEFEKENSHLKIKCERSNVIPFFVAHGTNAWALFSVFAFTDA